MWVAGGREGERCALTQYTVDKVTRMWSQAPAPEALLRQEAQAKESFSGFAVFPRKTELNRAKACVFGSLRKAGLGWAIGLVLQPVSRGSTLDRGRCQEAKKADCAPGVRAKQRGLWESVWS